MTMGVLAAGMLFLAMGLTGIAEGVLMIRDRNPNIAHDPCGAGHYLIIVSLALTITASIYMIHHRRSPAEGRIWEGKETLRAIQMTAVLAMFCVLIEIIGYFLSTIIFVSLVFRILGITSWRRNMIMTIVFSLMVYALFVWSAGMIFPRGILFS